MVLLLLVNAYHDQTERQDILLRLWLTHAKGVLLCRL
jgi:hypothetical protein